MAKDAAVSISGIVTFSTDAQATIDALPKKDQDRRFLEVAKAVAKHLGTDVAGVAVHRDESAIHAHFTLYGYGQDGQPVSRKMPKKVLSELQDVAAKAFDHDDITRGKKIGERIKNGEPYSKTINRSVRELHRDLPVELEAARARVADMQEKVTSTQEKLAARERELAVKDDKSAAQDKKLAKLQKRLTTYEKRLENRKAEAARLANLALIPRPKERVIEKPQPRKLGVLKQEPQRESLIFYTPEQMRGYAGKAKAALDALGGRHERLSNNVEQKIKHYQHATETRKNLETAGFEALGGELVVRYGLVVNETPKRVSVPPQKPASAAQIGAALYRASRDKSWKKTHFSVSDEVCQEILKMAYVDKRLNEVAFSSPEQQRGLETARKFARDEAEAAQRAAEQANQDNDKTGLQQEFEQQNQESEGLDFDDLDDEPSGPGMG